VNRRFIVSTLGALLLCGPSVQATGVATEEEARAMAIKAADYLKSVGPDKAFTEFNAKDGPWHDRDLYVTVEDGKGIMMANGANLGLVGHNVLDLKDPDGKLFQREKLEVKETGWINYRWLNPLSKAIEQKTMFIVRVGEYAVGVGAYAK